MMERSGDTTENLEHRIGHVFVDRSLLTAALTHSSSGGPVNYERLEFLGDRVLGLIVSEILYQKFPAESEGDLAKRLAALVQGSLLASVATEIDLADYIILSDSERGAGGSQNENILSDVLEALLGALYLDAGLDACRRMIGNLWGDRFYTMDKPPQHPKTALQEWAQGGGLPLPLYKMTGQSGPDHAPVFDITLSVKGYPDIHAQGRTRQLAEKEAAALFIHKLKSGSF